MCFYRGCGSGERSKALLCVLLVTFWLLVIARPMSAPSAAAPLVANVSRSVSSAVQEPLLTEGVQEIATTFNRSVDLLSNNWSWIKVALLQLGVLFVIEILKIFTGVLTQYLVDRWITQRNSRMHPTHQHPLPASPIEANREVDSLDQELDNSNAHLRDSLTLFEPVETNQDREGESTEKGKDAVNVGRGHHCCLSIEEGSRFPE